MSKPLIDGQLAIQLTNQLAPYILARGLKFIMFDSLMEIWRRFSPPYLTFPDILNKYCKIYCTQTLSPRVIKGIFGSPGSK